MKLLLFKLIVFLFLVKDLASLSPKSFISDLILGFEKQDLGYMIQEYGEIIDEAGTGLPDIAGLNLANWDDWDGALMSKSYREKKLKEKISKPISIRRLKIGEERPEHYYSYEFQFINSTSAKDVGLLQRGIEYKKVDYFKLAELKKKQRRVSKSRIDSYDGSTSSDYSEETLSPLTPAIQDAEEVFNASYGKTLTQFAGDTSNLMLAILDYSDNNKVVIDLTPMKLLKDLIKSFLTVNLETHEMVWLSDHFILLYDYIDFLNISMGSFCKYNNAPMYLSDFERIRDLYVQFMNPDNQINKHLDKHDKEEIMLISQTEDDIMNIYWDLYNFAKDKQVKGFKMLVDPNWFNGYVEQYATPVIQTPSDWEYSSDEEDGWFSRKKDLNFRDRLQVKKKAQYHEFKKQSISKPVSIRMIKEGEQKPQERYNNEFRDIKHRPENPELLYSNVFHELGVLKKGVDYTRLGELKKTHKDIMRDLRRNSHLIVNYKDLVVERGCMLPDTCDNDPKIIFKQDMKDLIHECENFDNFHHRILDKKLFQELSAIAKEFIKVDFDRKHVTEIHKQFKLMFDYLEFLNDVMNVFNEQSSLKKDSVIKISDLYIELTEPDVIVFNKKELKELELILNIEDDIMDVFEKIYDIAKTQSIHDKIDHFNFGIHVEQYA